MRAGVHPEDVPRPEHREDHLIAFHMRHRHGEHSIRGRRNQGHGSTAKREGVQPSLR